MSCGQASVANPYILEGNIALLVIYYEFVMQHSIVPLWLSVGGYSKVSILRRSVS